MLYERSNRSWAALLVVGSLVVTAIVLFQGIMTAASPLAAQGDEPNIEQREQRELPRERRLDGRAALLWSGTHGGRIGVALDEVETSTDNESVIEGALVRSVNPGSPAEEAGVEGGDVVVEFDGERVRSARQLSRLVGETPVGREIPVIVMRADERLSLRVTPEEGRNFSAAAREWLPDLGRLEQRVRDAVPHVIGEFDFDGRFLRRRRLGIGVTDVSQQLAEYFGVDHGVLVTTVMSESVAATAGVQAGDVLMAIDGEPVDDVGTLHRMVMAIDTGATFQLEVSRDGVVVTLQGRFEESRRENGRASPRI